MSSVKKLTKKGREVWGLNSMPGKNTMNIKEILTKRDIKLRKFAESRSIMTLRISKISKKSGIF